MTFTDKEEAMAHYGVKGMRWGVRKAPMGVGLVTTAAVGTAAVRGQLKTNRQSKSQQDQFGDDRSTFERRARKGAIVVGGLLAVVGTVALARAVHSRRHRAGQKMVELWWQNRQATKPIRKQRRTERRRARYQAVRQAIQNRRE